MWQEDPLPCPQTIRQLKRLNMENWFSSVTNWLKISGIDQEMSGFSRLFWLVIIWVVAFVITRIFRCYIIPIIQRITSSTKAVWDDYLFNSKLLAAVCRLIPPTIIYLFLPVVFSGWPYLLDVCMRACLIYMLVSLLVVIHLFLKSVYSFLNEHESFRDHPLKGIYQMVNLLAMGVGVILIVSVLINRDATTILAGLGASAAVMMLIFKDSILGLVAGVQLSVNDMLRPGDWITVPKSGADGIVLEVSLTTVKVQNFDKTITTIPPYSLVSDSFQNWRGMRESGGRRIKRAIYIDVQSIRFCTTDEVSSYKEKGWWHTAEEEALNPPVNLQVFRYYALQYISNHPKINHKMHQMIRQLQPTSEGVPVEIYCFSADTVWVRYEELQDDIIDHLLAVVHEFGLRVYQKPSGIDFHKPLS